MDAIEKRAQELLADELGEYEARLLVEGLGGTVTTREAMAAIIAALTLADKFEAQADAAIEAAQIAQRRADRSALTPPEGYVVVTRNEAGQAVAVTRQDDDGRILSVIAEFGPPEGYVLVPVEPTEAMLRAHAACGRDAFAVDEWAAMLAARPEVP